MLDWGALLAKKYAIAQQQADATTQNASTGALVGAAGARLDNTRAGLLPGQVAAEIAKLGADTFVATETGKTIAPESKARIKNLDANTGLTVEDTAFRRALTAAELRAQREIKVNPLAPSFFGQVRQQQFGF